MAAAVFSCGAVFARQPRLACAAPAATLVAPGLELAAAERAAAQHDGDFALIGMGLSMAPLYTSGTALVVRPTSYFMLRPGMPVVYLNRRGAHVAHVLAQKLERGWVVCGLNNLEPDDELVTPRNLIGVVKYAFAAEAQGVHSENLAGMTVAMASGGAPNTTLLH